MFSDLIRVGVDKIYAEDLDLQRNYIDKICSSVRGMPPDIVYKAEGFFIPGDDYFLKYFGPSIAAEEYNIYNYDSKCLWTNNIVFPFYNIAHKIVGLVGYNPLRQLEAKETHNSLLNHYTYSNKQVFLKGKYLFMIKDTYAKALVDGYLIVTDGVFDMLSFAGAGYNSGALLGSNLSEEIIAQLRFFRTIILAVDNDEAGMKLYHAMEKVLDNVVLLKQNKFKDSDDVLKSEYRTKYLAEVDHIINSGININHLVSF